MSATRYAISHRRNNLIKSIQNLQRQQIKSHKRAQLINTLNPPAEVYRLKEILTSCNIQYFPNEIAQIINSIKRLAYDPEFCLQLLSTRLIEDLFQTILGELKRKSYLQAPQLVQMLVCLTYDLLAKSSSFLGLVQNKLDYLLFAIFKYPLNNKIVQHVAGLFSYAEFTFINHKWRQIFTNNKFIEAENLICRLAQIFLLKENYETYCGSADFIEYRERGQPGWLTNASWTLQIIYSLLLICSNRQQILKIPLLKASISMGLFTHLQQKKQSWTSIEEECSDVQTQGDSSNYSTLEEDQSQKKWNYFINLILDITLLREELISQEDANLLKQNLYILLRQLNKNHGAAQAAIKCLKMLYEQVIFNEEDLLALCQRYPALSPFAEGIIHNDFL